MWNKLMPAYDVCMQKSYQLVAMEMTAYQPQLHMEHHLLCLHHFSTSPVLILKALAFWYFL